VREGADAFPRVDDVGCQSQLAWMFSCRLRLPRVRRAAACRMRQRRVLGSALVIVLPRASSLSQASRVAAIRAAANQAVFIVIACDGNPATRLCQR
jgi:hypothetical protein